MKHLIDESALLAPEQNSSAVTFDSKRRRHEGDWHDAALLPKSFYRHPSGNRAKYDVIISTGSETGIFRDVDNQNRLKRVFTDGGHTVELSVVSPGELEKALEKAVVSDSQAIIVGGGNRTITLAARMLKGTGKALGVLPLGEFNNTSDLHADLDPFEAANQLIDSDIVEIDMMEVNDSCCLCATVIGYHPALAKAREVFQSKPWWLKSLETVREIVAFAVNSPSLDLEITSDNVTIERRTRLAAFAPGQFHESIGIIPVRDDLSSAEINGYFSGNLSRAQTLSAAVESLSGDVFDTGRMIRVETNELIVDVKRRRSIPAMIDGEIAPIKLPCRMKVLPRALKVLRPRKAQS